MHVIVATDGSRASLDGARQFIGFADGDAVTEVTVVAVVSPYAAAPFANEIGPTRTPLMTSLSFADDARVAAETVAAEFSAWGPRVHIQVRSGSPAQEIIRAFTFPPFAYSSCNIVTVWQKIWGQAPTIENYLARESMSPTWLVGAPSVTRLTNQPQMTCWPDIPFSPLLHITIMSNKMLLRSREVKRPPL